MADLQAYSILLFLIVGSIAIQAAPAPQDPAEPTVTYDQRQNGSSGNLHLHMDGLAIVEAPADFLMTLGLTDEENPGSEGGGGFASWQQQLMSLMQHNKKATTESPPPPPPSTSKPKPVRGSGTKPKLR